jgi:predicted permease
MSSCRTKASAELNQVLDTFLPGFVIIGLGFALVKRGFLPELVLNELDQ